MTITIIITQECRSVPKETCFAVPKTVCHSVPSKRCFDLTLPRCEAVPREQCSKVSHTCHTSGNNVQDVTSDNAGPHPELQARAQ